MLFVKITVKEVMSLHFRKAILLIHGFAGGSYDYGELGNDLQLFLDFDVYTFTLPGHEKTFISKVKYNDWISAAEKQMDKLIKRGYKTIYVIGHSMGGVIASHIAKKYSTYVKKLVLAAPAFKYMYFKNDKIDLVKTIKKSPIIFEGLDTHVVLSRIFKVPINTALEFIKLVKEHQNDPSEITCPILIIHGTEDKVVPAASCEYVHNAVSSKVNFLIYIDEVNHDCFTGKRKEKVNEIITLFLRKKYLVPVKEKKNI